MSDLPLITVLTFTPLVGGLVLVGLDPRKPRLACGLALAFALVSLGIAGLMWGKFEPAAIGLQFEQRHDWIPTLGVQYFVGVDGLGMLMVMLSAIVIPMAILASGNLFAVTPISSLPRREGGHGTAEGNSRDPRNPQLYYALVLFLQAGLFGTFTALNFFHWFIFWELSLVPAFFLLRLWGGPQRSAAATQFFVYTMVGSVAMLLGFLAIWYATGTFDLIDLARKGHSGELAAALSARLSWYDLTTRQLALVVFAGVFLGFAVKVPLMPLHTWLPVAYAEAPTGTTMLLTGVMSKMGVYGFLRILLPLFPEQTRQIVTPLVWLAVATIVCSAAAAFAQRDLKRMLAYSSINHLGYCLLGAFAVMKLADLGPALANEKAAALNGVLLQMFNHGLTAATLFMLVGFLEQRAGGLRGLNEFGGLRKVAPVFCGLMGIAIFASLGLPGLNGFVGEFLILKGTFVLTPLATALATIGLLITAIFLLTLLQRVFNGPLNETWSKLPDLTLAERALVAVPIALMFLLGIYPQLVLGVINPTVMRMAEQLKF